MRLAFYIAPKDLVETYHAVKRLLTGYESVVFDAMVIASPRCGRGSFSLPASSAETQQKLDEIESSIRYAAALSGRLMAIYLMEEIWSKVKQLGGIPGLSTSVLLDALVFKTSSPNVALRLADDMHWVLQWPVTLRATGMTDDGLVSLDVHHKDWGEIVPTYVVQYVDIAIHAYRQGMTAPAIALLSIAVEATLRDVLETKGYTYNPGASSVDVYPYVDAVVGVSGGNYTVTFMQAMPKPTNDFAASIGSPTAQIQIRRVINQHKNNRLDLSVMAPVNFIDHWSSNVPQQSAQNRVNGLGEALKIARTTVNINSVHFPSDLDEVIKTMRNHLIHLSGDTLNIPLVIPGRPAIQTLENFLNDAEMVYDLIVHVPRFFNEQYIELRKAGHLVV